MAALFIQRKEQAMLPRLVFQWADRMTSSRRTLYPEFGPFDTGLVQV